MKHLILLSALSLTIMGCTSTARVDAFLRDTHQMPADKPTYGIPQPARNAFGIPMEAHGGTDLMPTRPSTYARADALEYARLYVKFGGKAPVPFGYDAQTDAGLLAMAEAQKAR